MRRLFAATLVAAVLVPGCGGGYKAAGTGGAPDATARADAGKSADAAKPAAAKLPRVRVETSMGVMVFELWPDKAPKTAANFLKLAGEGFYDGTLFHRVERGFVIQGGDPNTRGGDPSTWGQGGPAYRFEDEPVQGEYYKYSLAMANAGPNTNGSQFFVCTGDLIGRLPKQYNLFGKVVEGMAVADAIDAVPTRPVPGGMHSPVTPVKVIRMTVQ